jgi:NADP-dependent aldehyde dehydrogenase
MGPNNFPLAFNGIAGGDFAAAIAAGNPVIAKAHPSHPRTSQLMAEQAHEAAKAAGLPAGAVQMIYKMPRAEGERMMGDPRLASAAFTGSRPAGMALKKVADAAGKPIYLEMSSVNPVYFLPNIVKQKRADLVGELATSALMGSGQFCTSPALVGRSPRNAGRIGRLAAEGRGRGVNRRSEGRRRGHLLSQHAAARVGKKVSRKSAQATDRGLRQRDARGRSR